MTLTPTNDTGDGVAPPQPEQPAPEPGLVRVPMRKLPERWWALRGPALVELAGEPVAVVRPLALGVGPGDAMASQTMVAFVSLLHEVAQLRLEVARVLDAPEGNLRTLTARANAWAGLLLELQDRGFDLAVGKRARPRLTSNSRRTAVGPAPEVTR